MKPHHVAYILAGSNLGDRQANIQKALSALRESGFVPRKQSDYFETEPVGYSDQPWFLNLAAEIETHLTPHQLLRGCQKIEESLGRLRTFHNAPRTLDLDILLFESIVLDEPCLIIPHPRMAERRFVLTPLAQIAPDVVHPVLKQSIRSLLTCCADPSEVRLYRPGNAGDVRR
jgi:2-amino-4-hydroxy-6-hydroxymethyldihydropteridine diphosphokinase